MDIWENIINSYSNESITTNTIISILVMVTILSIYEFFVYRVVSHKSFYNKSFNITIAILPFFISTIVLCLQSNFVITLGTIGALAIIRFRTSIKDPTDMLYLLWSVFIGIISGCQLFEVGILTSLVVTIILIILEHINFGRKPLVLIARSKEDIESDLVELLKLKKVNYKIKSRNYSSKGFDYAIELVYKNVQELNNELSKNKKINSYSIIEYDADDIA